MGESKQPKKKMRRVLGAAFGALLLGFAVAYAVQGVDVAALRSTPAWAIAALGGLVVANLLLTAGLFWAVTRSFDAQPAVSLRRMTALIAVSGLLNYLPVVRAGLWGRAAFLKQHHALAVRQSVVILGVVLGLAVVVLGGVSGALLLAPAERQWLVVGLVVGALAAAAPVVGKLFLGRGVAGAWVWVLLRGLDLAAAAGRLWLGFWIVGHTVPAGDAVLLASASLLGKLSGVTPNGLGLSEWVVAVLAAALTPIETATAAAAALVDRTIEVIVTLTAGTLGLASLRSVTQAPR